MVVEYTDGVFPDLNVCPHSIVFFGIEIDFTVSDYGITTIYTDTKIGPCRSFVKIHAAMWQTEFLLYGDAIQICFFAMFLDTQDVNMIFLDNLFYVILNVACNPGKSIHVVTGNCYFIFLRVKNVFFPGRLGCSGEIVVIADKGDEGEDYPPFFANGPKDKKV